MIVVPVGGTWSQEAGAHDWWRPASVWVANLRNAGLSLLDAAEPFQWSAALAIDAGQDPLWRTSGLALKWYCQAKTMMRTEELTVVAHSHGGNVLAFALAAGLRLRRALTVGMPVRQDMAGIYAAARPNVDQWTQLYCEEVGTPFQILGCLPEVNPAREVAEADVNLKVEPPTSHHGLMWPHLWLEHDWYQALLA